MAEYTADQFIGKTLIAKKNVWEYKGYPKSASKMLILAGSVLDSVYSWVKDPDNGANVYWVFQKNGVDYFVKHNVNDIGIHPSETVETIDEKKKREAEEKKKAEEGNILYYIEKYGKPILILAGVGLAVKAYTAYAGRKGKQ